MAPVCLINSDSLGSQRRSIRQLRNIDGKCRTAATRTL